MFEFFSYEENTHAKFKIYIETLKHFSLDYDEEYKQIISTEHYELIKNIDIINLNNLVYKIKSSENLSDSHTEMSFLAKHMYFILEKNSKFRKKDYLKIFTNDFLDTLKRECNGYFRHGINDSGHDPAMMQKWENMTIIEKKLKINTTLTHYLAILSILRDNGEIMEFMESFHNLLNPQS